MMRRGWIVLLLLCCVTCAQAATPTVRAFLDRTQVSLGDTVTLNLQSDSPIANPDLAPLGKDFQLLGSSSSTSVQIVNGKVTRSTQLGIALRPLHAGTLTIPALDVGGARTQALTLTVGSAPAGGTGKVGDPVFVEVHVSSSAPYVGEQIVYTARLFYLPGIDGNWGDPQADGARLIKLDRDHQYTAERNGYSYEVIERSWVVIPGRTGSITIAGPQFQGQQMTAPGMLFGNPNLLPGNPSANGAFPGLGKVVRAIAPQVALEVRPIPATAGKPWLPARDVQLKLTGLPANGAVAAGVPLTVTLAIDAVGLPADALPEPQLPAIAGTVVYPDQTRDATDATGPWLQGSRTRSFAIVPQRDGTLALPAITLAWWNVASDHEEQASVPARTLRVTGSIATPSASMVNPAGSSATGGSAPLAQVHVPMVPYGDAPWRGVALASLAAWIVALALLGAWWWRRHAQRGLGVGSLGDTPGQAAPASASDAGAVSPMPHPRPPDQRTLQANALAAARAGDAATCERALLAWARALRSDITHAGALRDTLADRTQCSALDMLQRARWHGGDAAAACTAVADTFAGGFKWRVDAASTAAGDPRLPPLYPGQQE